MKSKFGIRDLNAENHWVELDLADFKLKLPLIVCLSGSGTRTTADANGFCKLAESLLGEKAQLTTILGASYSFDEKKPPNTPAAFSDEEVNFLVEKVLLPLCQDKQGNLYPLDKCCKNLSLVTFFTFCHGSTETERIIQKLDEVLQSKGFSEEQVKQANASLLEISYDSEVRSTSCPRIEFSPQTCAGGSMICARLFEDDVDLDKVMAVYDKPGEVAQKPMPYYNRDGEQITFVSGSILNSRREASFNDLESQDQEHNVGFFKEGKDGSLNPNLSEQGRVLRQAMAMTLDARLENSIENLQSEQYKPFELKNLCEIATQTLNVCTPNQIAEKTAEV